MTQKCTTLHGYVPKIDVEKLGQPVGFVGAGNMAEALIKGFLAVKLVEPGQVTASDPRRERIAYLKERFSIQATAHNEEVARRADILVLAVKPQILTRVCDEIAPHLRPGTLVVSMAAGVPVAVVEAHLPAKTRVVRVMPNIAALVGEAATAIAAGGHATEDDLKVAGRLFDAIGMTVVLDEEQLDAVTGLSGSGPAYVFLIIEALADAGVKVGLPRYHAQALAAQTILGAARLLIETEEHPGRLKDMVTSPGGTAIAGLHTLEAGGLRTTLINAVEEATRRSRELGQIAIANDASHKT